jgi:hypothetical protein
LLAGEYFFVKLMLGNYLINLWWSTYIVQRELLNLRHDTVLMAIRLRFEGEITEFWKLGETGEKKRISWHWPDLQWVNRAFMKKWEYEAPSDKAGPRSKQGSWHLHYGYVENSENRNHRDNGLINLWLLIIQTKRGDTDIIKCLNLVAIQA